MFLGLLKEWCVDLVQDSVSPEWWHRHHLLCFIEFFLPLFSQRYLHTAPTAITHFVLRLLCYNTTMVMVCIDWTWRFAYSGTLLFQFCRQTKIEFEFCRKNPLNVKFMVFMRKCQHLADVSHTYFGFVDCKDWPYHFTQVPLSIPPNTSIYPPILPSIYLLS